MEYLPSQEDKFVDAGLGRETKIAEKLWMVEVGCKRSQAGSSPGETQ